MLATSALAGNVGAIAASTLAIKDFREKDRPVPAQFADSVFWFGLGALVSTLALGAVALASEIIAHVVSTRRPANDSHQEGWDVYFKRLHIGQIGKRSGVPTSEDQRRIDDFVPYSPRRVIPLTREAYAILWCWRNDHAPNRPAD